MSLYSLRRGSVEAANGPCAQEQYAAFRDTNPGGRKPSIAKDVVVDTLAMDYLAR